MPIRDDQETADDDIWDDEDPWDEETEEEAFPWEDISASRRNRRLQRKHPLDEAARYRGEARPCQKCGKAERDLAWFYFESPSWTWRELCGAAGWMTVCDDCRVQVDFFMEAMN